MTTIEEVMLDRYLLEGLQQEEDIMHHERIAAELEVTVDELYRRMHPGHS